MSPAWTLIWLWLAFLGLIGLVLMGVDKARARDRAWRIPERALLTLALMGGSYGILLGALLFHHKTRKGLFMAVVLTAVSIWSVTLMGLERFPGLP